MIPRCIHHQGVDLNWVQKICWCKIHHVVTRKVFCKSVLMVIQNTRSRLPGVFTTGESRLPGAFITGDSFVPLRSQFTDFKAHRTVYHSNYRLQVLLKLPRIMWFMFLKNCLTLGGSNWLSGVFFTGESILKTNKNNSENILKKNQNCFWACLLGPRKVYCWQKPGTKIS
jgi:hypothetical protein